MYLPALEAGTAACGPPCFWRRGHPRVSVGPRSFVASAAALVPSARTLPAILPAGALGWAVSRPVALLQDSSSQRGFVEYTQLAYISPVSDLGGRMLRTGRK